MIALKKHSLRRILVVLGILGILVFLLSVYGQPINKLQFGRIEISSVQKAIDSFCSKISIVLTDLSDVPNKVLIDYEHAKQQLDFLFSK